MALPVSPNSISFGQIRNEFGPLSGPVSLGDYRISQDVGTLSNRPLDTGIPQSGTIKFSDFRGKRLNIVVDFFSIENDTTRRNARSRYDNNGVTVIGGFRSRPSSSSGTKVFINVNKRIGSNKSDRNNVALKTGSWNSDTQLSTIIGSDGSLYGAGGNGGNGGGIPGAAGQGGQGSSALGIEYPTTIINQGVIFAGRGGGGGGAGGYGWNFQRTQDGCEGRNDESRRIGGAGGAGGRGFPGGNGGAASLTVEPSDVGRNFAGNGSSGTVNSNGLGGGGGNTFNDSGCDRHAFSGAGGGAESNGSGGNVSYGGEGQGGQRGYAIIIGSGGSLISYSGNSASGDTVNGTVS